MSRHSLLPYKVVKAYCLKDTNNFVSIFGYRWMNEWKYKFIERAQKPTSVGLISALSKVKPVCPGKIYDWKIMVEMICGKGVFWVWSEREKGW